MNLVAVKGLVSGLVLMSTLFVVKGPVYFTDQQFDRPLVIYATPEPTARPAVVASPVPNPSPSPSPTPKPTASPMVHELETEYGTVRYTRVIEQMWAMSYDSTCSGCSDTTATGMKQGYGVVAVDPSVIPLYSRVYVPGYGVGVAGDVGGAIKGKKIDLGYDSLNGQWSAHYVDVYLLAE